MTPRLPPEPDVESLSGSGSASATPGPTPPPWAAPSSWPASATPGAAEASGVPDLGLHPRGGDGRGRPGPGRRLGRGGPAPRRGREGLVTLEEIATQFGPEVAKISDGLAAGLIGFEGREARPRPIIRAMVIAMARDIRVLVIKLADRLHNMRDVGYLDREAQEGKACEVLEIYAPLATASASTRSNGSWRTWSSRPCTPLQAEISSA